MIIDLQRFLQTERPFWSELESFLGRIEQDPGYRPGLGESKRFHYLYERTAGDLARLVTFASEPELRGYLESLVARAYAEVHESRTRPRRASPWRWFTERFPQTFRRHRRAFWLSVAATLAGCLLGGFAVVLDPDAKSVLLPFPHLQGNPAERVADEERQAESPGVGLKTTFSAVLMTHNTKVAIFTMALGLSWGIGTLVILFYNGVILGAVSIDYLMAGQGGFLAGWLLPHGSVEIPSILIAGQAGFVLASALIGWGRRVSLRSRLRAVVGDLVTLIGGVAVMLFWAGLVEAFFSQYHEPIMPYAVKIAFGLLELTGLILFLTLAGRAPPPAAVPQEDTPTS